MKRILYEKDIEGLSKNGSFIMNRQGRLFPCTEYMWDGDIGYIHPSIVRNNSPGDSYTISLLLHSHSLEWFYEHAPEYGQDIKAIAENIHIFIILSKIYNRDRDVRHYDSSEMTGIADFVISNMNPSIVGIFRSTDLAFFEEMTSVLSDDIVDTIMSRKVEILNYRNFWRDTAKLMRDTQQKLNEQFLRIRIGGEYFTNNTNQVWFRILSTTFNWYDNIAKFLENGHSRALVTIEYDADGNHVNDDSGKPIPVVKGSKEYGIYHNYPAQKIIDGVANTRNLRNTLSNHLLTSTGKASLYDDNDSSDYDTDDHYSITSTGWYDNAPQNDLKIEKLNRRRNYKHYR